MFTVRPFSTSGSPGRYRIFTSWNSICGQKTVSFVDLNNTLVSRAGYKTSNISVRQMSLLCTAGQIIRNIYISVPKIACYATNTLWSHTIGRKRGQTCVISLNMCFLQSKKCTDMWSPRYTMFHGDIASNGLPSPSKPGHGYRKFCKVS